MPEKPSYAKPLPTPSPEAKFFWDKAKAHEPGCRIAALATVPTGTPATSARPAAPATSSGAAHPPRHPHTFAIHHRAFHPAWVDEIPYVTALVTLEEGPRIFTNLVGIEPDPKSIHCEMPLEATFEDVAEEVTLVKFRPAS
jgi:hypothetical protein